MTVPLYDTLDGQVALVTGANRGIGAAVASALADLGATVYAGARDASSVEDASVRPIELDVLDEDTVRSAVAGTIDEAGRLDVVVNNAGIIGPSTGVADLDLDEFDLVWGTNTRGALAVAKHALPHLLAREGGRIVNVSSGAGSFGEGMMPSHVPYCTSKAGLNALTFLLHERYHGRGLIVNSVCPGWVRTDMGGHSAPRSVDKGAETPVWLARFGPGAPSGGSWRDMQRIEW